MTEKQAALTSMREYVLRREGKDKELRDKWEVARWMKWQDVILSPNIKVGSKPRTPQAFCRFPWDEQPKERTREDCHISEETLEWLNRRKERYYNKEN